MKSVLCLMLIALSCSHSFADDKKMAEEMKKLNGKLEITVDGKSTLYDVTPKLQPIGLLGGRVVCGANEVNAGWFRITCLADKVEVFTVVSCNSLSSAAMMGVVVDQKSKMIGLKYFCDLSKR